MAKKRKLPAHIVLPNGMWRFVKSGAKKVSRKAKVRHKKRTVGVVRVARRSRKRASGRRGFGGMSMTRGLLPVGGIVASALLGAGAATLQEKFLPQMIPMQGAVAGFAVGGVGGAIGAFARDILKGGVTSQAVNY